MARLHVEGWAPDYGSPIDTDDSLERTVDETVEVSGPWEPIPGADDGAAEVVFVDGVRRVDARLTLDEPTGLVSGLCGSLAVGAVTWERETPRSQVTSSVVQRLAVFGDGRGQPVPVAGPELMYRTESIPETDPGMLIQHFHGRMRKAEAELSEELAKTGAFVIADGPINDLSATEKVGYIKSHRVGYLSPEKAPIIGRLRAGQRTPLFLIGATGAYPRYSWYLRLADIAGGHSWTGIVRAEVSSHLDLPTAQRIADRATALLPKFSAPMHVDSRAPQNLVPIAALERELRRLLGDPEFVYRRLRAAVGAAA
ncbi:MAG: hypothetical protein KJO84_00475 [Acidimicrobiia bacterium]|nr:hypothetical protein [Acidimicrobiia bacterium]